MFQIEKDNCWGFSRFFIPSSFDIPEDKDTYFDNATRNRIVNFILRRKPFSREKEKAYSFGEALYIWRMFWEKLDIFDGAIKI